MKQRMLLGKAQRSSVSASALRPSATAVGLLPTVPSAGSEEGLPGREPRRSEGALGAGKALHGSFSRLPSPRCEAATSHSNVGNTEG